MGGSRANPGMLGLSGEPLSVKLGTGRWREIDHGEVVPVVYLVRHAHAGKKAQWQGPDQARPLSAQGRKEALGLRDQLRDLPVRRLLSSPAELIRGVFDRLQSAGIELSSPPQWPKGSTWVLRRDGRGRWKGTYLEPVVVEARVEDTLPR